MLAYETALETRGIISTQLKIFLFHLAVREIHLSPRLPFLYHLTSLALFSQRCLCLRVYLHLSPLNIHNKGEVNKHGWGMRAVVLTLIAN